MMSSVEKVLSTRTRSGMFYFRVQSYAALRVDCGRGSIISSVNEQMARETVETFTRVKGYDSRLVTGTLNEKVDFCQ